MDKSNLLETTPVLYGASGVKTIYFSKVGNEPNFRMHWHERIEILRVYEGELTVNLGTKTVIVKKDEAVIVPPRTPHSGDTKVKTEYCAVMFDVRNFYNQTEIGENLLSALFEGRVITENIVSDKQVISAIDDVAKNTSGQTEDFCVMAGVYSLLSKLFSKGIFVLNGLNTTDKTMRKITDYIESNFTKELSTADICNHFGYTVPYFCKKFKSNTGLSPMSYLKIYRIEKAYSMLKQGDTKISELAEKCGFSDANYFTRCFTAHFGHPPKYYIKNKNIAS